MKISMSDLDKYKSKGGGAGFFSLKDDGDTAKVRFMIESEEDLNDYIYVVHDVEVSGSQYPKPVNCLREYDSPISDCPLCEAGYKTATKIVLPLYDIEDDSIKMWTRSRTFISKMTSLCSRYKDLVSHTFDVERVGAKGDKKTSYELYETGSDDTSLEDLPEVPEILGDRFILDKSIEDMEFYLEQGEFPPDETEADLPSGDGAFKRRSKRSDEDDDDDEEERPRRRSDKSSHHSEGRRTPARSERRRPSKADKF